MNHWIVYVLLALVTWGLWGLFPKLAVRDLSPNSALFYQSVGTAICGIVISLVAGGKPEFVLRGASFAALTGVTAIVGGWFYLYAAREANISTVVVITALYPMITVILAATFLKEPISLRQAAAMMLALAAIVLLSTEQST